MKGFIKISLYILLFIFLAIEQLSYLLGDGFQEDRYSP